MRVAGQYREVLVLYLEVLVLYLDRPLRDVVACIAVCGRFRYSDLKEVAMSGASMGVECG